VASLSLLRSHHDLLPLATINFLFQFAQQVLPNVFVLYTTLRFHWSLRFLGLTFLITGALGLVVSFFVVAPVVKRIGERGAVIVGALCGASGFLIYALAPSQIFYFIGMPIFALSGLMQPGLQGLMTAHVSASEQGRLQGANQSIMGIASILGPLVFLSSFAFALRHIPGVPGLPIVVASALLTIALVLALRFARRETRAPQPA
jgi:DHA1 family tetracycline resistance protein-like MFS transporter